MSMLSTKVGPLSARNFVDIQLCLLQGNSQTALDNHTLHFFITDEKISRRGVEIHSEPNGRLRDVGPRIPEENPLREILR